MNWRNGLLLGSNSAIPNSLAAGLIFSDMVRVVDCHTGGVLGSNPGGPKRFSPWNHFTCGSCNLVAPDSASGSGTGLYLVVVDARLS